MAHFSLATVLELRSIRSGFDGQLCVCMLPVIIRTGGVETFFSPVLPTCALFSKNGAVLQFGGKGMRTVGFDRNVDILVR